MKDLTYLKELLFEDVRKMSSERNLDYHKRKVQLFYSFYTLTNKKSYNEMYSQLDKISQILDSIYGDKNIEKHFKDILNSLLADDNNKKVYDAYLRHFLNKVYADYFYEKDLMSIRSKININDIITSRRIISQIKYKQVLSKESIEFVKKRLIREGLEDKEIIYILELINVHNIKNKKDATKFSYNELYSIINLLKQGFELINIPFNDNDKLDSIANNLISMIDESGIDISLSVLKSMNYYDDQDLEYIYYKLLLNYQEAMFIAIEALKDKDNYFDKDILTIIKEDYYLAYKNYIAIRNLLDELKNKKVEEEKYEDLDKNIKKLYYSTNNQEDPSKCYFIKDLRSIRLEGLDKVLKLLNDFQKGITSKIKVLKNSIPAFELKNDQVCIILRKISNDCYSVMGVFIKKSDNDRDKYNNYINRPLAIIDDDYSMKVEDIYKTYIGENQRKGR